MINVRRYKDGDEIYISELIAKDLYSENIKDYKKADIDKLVKTLNADFIKQRAKMFHGYVLVDLEKNVGVGMIGPYWGSETESSFFTIFIDPEYKGKGLGRKIIETLEKDIYYQRANRVEIPASITALQFYRHFGYGFKITNQVKGNIVDEEGEYRLEKYPKIAYYNNTDTYNIRPYINNKYHNYNDFIYNFLKEKYNSYETFLEDIEKNADNILMIEYNGQLIGCFDKNNLSEIYLISKYQNKNIEVDIQNSFEEKNKGSK